MSEPGTLPLPELGLSAEEAANRFGRLQQKLVPLWRSIRAFNQQEQTFVVVPSITAEFRAPQCRRYEERFLFLLLLLRQPRARMIYVTSQSILPSTAIDFVVAPARCFLLLSSELLTPKCHPRDFRVSARENSTKNRLYRFRWNLGGRNLAGIREEFWSLARV